MTPETHTATVDRIVDGEHVVLLLESGATVADEVVLARERVPSVEAGDVVTVVRDEEEVLEVRRDETETDRRRREIRDRFDRLSERLPGSDDESGNESSDDESGNENSHDGRNVDGS